MRHCSRCAGCVSGWVCWTGIISVGSSSTDMTCWISWFSLWIFFPSRQRSEKKSHHLSFWANSQSDCAVFFCFHSLPSILSVLSDCDVWRLCRILLINVNAIRPASMRREGKGCLLLQIKMKWRVESRGRKSKSWRKTKTNTNKTRWNTRQSGSVERAISAPQAKHHPANGSLSSSRQSQSNNSCSLYSTSISIEFMIFLFDLSLCDCESNETVRKRKRQNRQKKRRRMKRNKHEMTKPFTCHTNAKPYEALYFHLKMLLLHENIAILDLTASTKLHHHDETTHRLVAKPVCQV